MESRWCKLFAVKNDTDAIAHAQWMKWVWEGENLPAAPARCGNNEEALTYEVRSGPIRVGSRSRSQVKVQEGKVQSEAGVGCSGARVPRFQGRAGCGQARQLGQADGSRGSPR